LLIGRAAAHVCNVCCDVGVIDYHIRTPQSGFWSKLKIRKPLFLNLPFSNNKNLKSVFHNGNIGKTEKWCFFSTKTAIFFGILQLLTFRFSKIWHPEHVSPAGSVGTTEIALCPKSGCDMFER
jgi:hypothetical protein